MHKPLIGVSCLLMAMLSANVQAHAGHDHGHAPAADRHHASPSHPDPATVSAPEGISVKDCWIRALPSRLPAAAYFHIQNMGEQEKVLTGAQAEGFGRVMLHTHQDQDGMARMVHAENVKLAPGSSLEFAPRGHHVMLEQANFDLKVGTERPLTLWFAGPEALTVQCKVLPPGTLQ